MFFNWKGAAIVLAVLAAVVGLCAVDLRCSGGVGPNSSAAHIRNEWAAGKKAMRQQEAENLTQVVRSLCELAHRYKANGETKKAQRAMGAALELEKKIATLLEEK